MGGGRHSAAQIIGKLREPEVLQGKGEPTEQGMRQFGISDSTFCKLRKE